MNATKSTPPELSATRTVIITGGNAGLGFHCARAIAADKTWHVVLAGRDAQRTSAAAARIASESGNPSIEALALDLASLASVRAFPASYQQHPRPPLEALVCNAGVQVARGIAYTADGFEMMFGVHHLGHFLLVHRLLPLLAAPARIVVVSSGTHDPNGRDGIFGRPVYRDAASLAWPERPGAPKMGGLRRYATSKLCNLLFAYELERRLRACGHGPEHIAVLAYDPGATPRTGLSRQQSKAIQWIWESPVTALLLRPLGMRFYTPEVSGAAMARLVLDPALRGASGRYFHVQTETKSSKESYDLDKATELWEASCEIVGLDAAERGILSASAPREPSASQR